MTNNQITYLPVRGDISGTTGGAIVIKLQGNSISSQKLTSAQDGYVLTWNNTGGVWQANPNSGGSGFIAGGDLSGTSTVQTVSKIQGITISGTPGIGQVLTATSSIAASWQNSVSGFTAAGDLSGTSSSQTVIKINGATVPAAGALVNGTVLQVSGSSALSYSLLSDANISSSAAISGTKISPNFGSQIIITTNVLNSGSISTGVVNASSITSSGALLAASIRDTGISSAGAVLTDASGNFSSGTINLASATFISGTLATSHQANQTMGGDVTGTTAAATVVKINGVSVTGTPSSGQIITATGAITATWQNAPSGSFSAAGDLSGTSSSQTVIKINGNPVTTQSLSVAQDGYVLTWSFADGYYKAAPSTGGGGGGGAPSGPAGGNLFGTYPNPLVAVTTPIFFASLATTLPNGTRSLITLDGYAVANDGGGGTFAWATGSFTNDGGTIVVPTGMSGIGAWIRQERGHLDVAWFGAQMDTSTPFAHVAVQKAITAAAGFGTMGNPPPPVNLKLISNSTGNSTYWFGAPVVITTNDLTVQGVSGSLDNGLVTIRCFHKGPAFITAPPVAAAPITQDGSSGFWGLAIGPSNSNYNMNMSQFEGGYFNGFSAFTLEFWVSGVSSQSGILFYSHGSRLYNDQDSISLYVSLAGGQINSRISTATSAYNPGVYPSGLNTGFLAISSTVISTGTRTKVAIVYDGSQLRNYINGTLDGYVPATGIMLQSKFEDFIIGGIANGGWPLGNASGSPNVSLYSIKFSNVVRYTGPSYVVEGTELTTADANTRFLINFDPSYMYNTATNVLQFLTASNTQVYQLIFNDHYGVAQLTGAYINNLCLQGTGGSSIFANASPATKITNIKSTGFDCGPTLNNNCYVSKINDIKSFPASPSRGCHSWGLGLLNTSGVSEVRQFQCTGGEYCYVESDSGSGHELFYTIPTGTGNVLIKNTGSPGVGSFRDMYCGDESGSQSGSCLSISGQFDNLNFYNASFQRLTSTGPVVEIDVSVGAIMFDCGDFQSVPTAPACVFTFPHGMQSASPIQVDSSVLNNLFGGGSIPWVDGYNPGYVTLNDLEITGVAQLNFISNANLPVPINTYLNRAVNVTDISHILNVDGYAILFPFNDNGRIKNIYNNTAHNIVVAGITGIGITLAAGKQAEFQCINSVWQQISSANTISNFTPILLPSLSLWLEANAGTTLVGSAVSVWADQSGAGNNAIQGTSLNRPTFITNSSNFNNQPSISFNGTTSFMTISNATNLQITGDFTFFTVVYYTNSTPMLLSKNFAAGEFWFNIGAGSTLNRYVAGHPVGGGAVTGLANNTPIIIFYRQKSGNLKAGSQAVNLNSISASVGSVTPTSSPVTIGLEGGGALAGEQPEIILYKTALSDNDFYSVLVYLSQKYNIPLSF